MRDVMRGIVTVLVIALSMAALTASCFSIYQSYTASHDRSVDLCRNQHSIIEMQRLFLDEHEAIRLQLEEAGIPNQHANSELLVQLGALIEAADCNVNDLD